MRKHTFSLTLLLLGWMSFTTAEASLRIVSLAPSLSKNLLYMGAEKNIVGCTSYCKTTKKKEIVASAVKVNVEKVISLKPDLVIATTLTGKDALTTLRKFGIKVVVYPTAKSFEEICAQFLDLGRLTGRETQANLVIRETRQKVDSLKAMPHPSQKMFLQIGANPLFAVIPNTFMNDYITFSGAKNIASDMAVGTITRETVLQRNPDVVFIVTMGIVGGAEKNQWEGVKSLNASKHHKIFIIESDEACTPSPVSFAETLETIANLIR